MSATTEPSRSKVPYDEWLIDEAIRQTFPASDPISPGQPGSLVGLRYAAQQRAARRAHDMRAATRGVWWVVAGCAVVYALWLTSRRKRVADRNVDAIAKSLPRDSGEKL